MHDILPYEYRHMIVLNRPAMAHRAVLHALGTRSQHQGRTQNTWHTSSKNYSRLHSGEFSNFSQRFHFFFTKLENSRKNRNSPPKPGSCCWYVTCYCRIQCAVDHMVYPHRADTIGNSTRHLLVIPWWHFRTHSFSAAKFTVFPSLVLASYDFHFIYAYLVNK